MVLRAPPLREGSRKEGVMSTHDSMSEKLSAAASQAREALDAARQSVAETDLDALKSKASDAASAVYRQGRTLANSDAVNDATEQLAASIRRNPLAAVGVAFTAGLVLALLTRG